MEKENDFDLVEALLPPGYEMRGNGDNSRKVLYGDKEVTLTHSSENTWVLDGNAIHFDDKSDEVVNTMLVPLILQALDGNRRF